jgi:probable rRNA maturation factor
MIEINNTTKFKISERRIMKIAESFLAHYRLRKKDVSIAFIGDKKMRELNFRYRKKDRPTDVLSFEGGESGGSDFGEIIIDLAQIKRQAKENNNSFEQELIFILVHGLLHLAGREDDTEKKRLAMIAEGEKFIKKC